MGFLEELKQERLNKIKEHAKDFARQIKDDIVESAKDGYTGYNINLENREDAHILSSAEFLEELEGLLEGCKVSIKTDEYKHSFLNTKYYKHKLNISWI